MAQLTNFKKIENRKLKEIAKPIQIPKNKRSAKAVNNQELLTAFVKRFALDN